MKTELFPLCAVAIVDFCTFTRLSTLGKSVLALRPRCSTWCLTRDRQTCGYPRKAAPHFPPPVVSTGALGCKTRSAANDCLFMTMKQMTMTNKQFNLKEIYIDELPDLTINQSPFSDFSFSSCSCSTSQPETFLLPQEKSKIACTSFSKLVVIAPHMNNYLNSEIPRQQPN